MMRFDICMAVTLCALLRPQLLPPLELVLEVSVRCPLLSTNKLLCFMHAIQHISDSLDRCDGLVTWPRKRLGFRGQFLILHLVNSRCKIR